MSNRQSPIADRQSPEGLSARSAAWLLAGGPVALWLLIGLVGLVSAQAALAVLLAVFGGLCLGAAVGGRRNHRSAIRNPQPAIRN